MSYLEGKQPSLLPDSFNKFICTSPCWAETLSALQIHGITMTPERVTQAMAARMAGCRDLSRGLEHPRRTPATTDTHTERTRAASYSPRAYHSPSCAMSTLGGGSQLTCSTSWHPALHSCSHSVYGQWCQEQLWESIEYSYHGSLCWTGYKAPATGLQPCFLVSL